jgi:hypothetical protein
VLTGPDGFPSIGCQLYRELAEEIGFNHDAQVTDILPGWITGASKREGSYHLSMSFIVPVKQSSKELAEYFGAWREVQKLLGGKTEFRKLEFLPNDEQEIICLLENKICWAEKRAYWKRQQTYWKSGQAYHTDIERLRASKGQTRIIRPG